MADDAGNLLEEHYKSSLGYVDENDNDNEKDNADTANADSQNENEHENGHENQNEEKEEDPLDDNGEQKDNDENVPPSNNTNDSSKPPSNTEAPSTMSPLETLETLSTLHALQQNLSSTKSILHSVSTYDKTMSTLPSLLTSSTNLNHAVTALCTLEEGARALSGMPGGEKRQEEILETRNKILTLLKPELLHALNKVDSRLGPLQTCVGMYSSLGRIECLMEEYVRNRPSSVHRLWFEFGKMSAGKTKGGRSNLNNKDELEFYDDGEISGDGMDDDDTMEDGEKLNVESNRTSFGEWLRTW